MDLCGYLCGRSVDGLWISWWAHVLRETRSRGPGDGWPQVLHTSANTHDGGASSMGRRAMWSGAITFGMVNIPVKLFSATNAKDISFNLLHSTCGTRVQQKRWCPTDDAEVPWEEIVRGYDYAKGQYVTLTDDDFEKLPLPSKNTIAISAFVQASEIDPVYYEKSYYLEPDARGEKAYALLLKALSDKELTGIATITMRKKEQLCSIRGQTGTLMLETLFYP